MFFYLNLRGPAKTENDSFVEYYIILPAKYFQFNSELIFGFGLEKAYSKRNDTATILLLRNEKYF